MDSLTFGYYRLSSIQLHPPTPLRPAWIIHIIIKYLIWEHFGVWLPQLLQSLTFQIIFKNSAIIKWSHIPIFKMKLISNMFWKLHFEFEFTSFVCQNRLDSIFTSKSLAREKFMLDLYAFYDSCQKNFRVKRYWPGPKIVNPWMFIKCQKLFWNWFAKKSVCGV